MAMARFEVGANGNPHMHGFSLGKPGPKMTRVEADVREEGDLPPQTVSEDVRVFLKRFEKADDGSMECKSRVQSCGSWYAIISLM